MAGEEAEALRWRDLSADEVYHIAHIEADAREAAAAEVGGLNKAFLSNPFESEEVMANPKAKAIFAEQEAVAQRWLDGQQVVRSIVVEPVDTDGEQNAGEAASPPNDGDELAGPSDKQSAEPPEDETMPVAINVGSPEGSPIRTSLRVPADLVRRYELIRQRLEKTGQDPSGRFAAAAVLNDIEQQVPDTEIVGLARDLEAVDGYLRQNPGAPILLVSKVFLQTGIVAPDSGLGFENFGSADLGMTMTTVPCESFIEADVEISDDVKVSAANIQGADDYGRKPLEFLTPRRILAPHNRGDAADISRYFLEEPVLIVGKDVTTEFFKRLLAKRRGSKGSEQRRLAAEQVVNFLASNIATLS